MLFLDEGRYTRCAPSSAGKTNLCSRNPCYHPGVIVQCAQCNTTILPGDAVCPICQSADHIMVGMSTPSGTRVLANRDNAKRLRIQGRRKDDGHMTFRAVLGGPLKAQPPPSSAAGKAPHLKLYSDVLWSYDRQRLERREMHIDSENDYYMQVWYSLETGEITWGPKEGKLSDPDMHGESARRRRAG